MDDRIVYETGVEENGIRWSVLYAPSEEVAFREHKKFCRNYIKRHSPTMTEQWDFENHGWIKT